MNDDIFNESYIPAPPPSWKPKSKFEFWQGNKIEFADTKFHVYRATEDYVTIMIRKMDVDANLMQFMDNVYDAVYVGPMIEWTDGVHVTFKRKS